MNFDYLKEHESLKDLYTNCSASETLVFSNPALSMTSARMALEYLVKLVYKVKIGDYDESADLYTLCKDPNFTCHFQEGVLKRIAYVRKAGNDAAHGEKVTEADALLCLKTLYFTIWDILVFMGEVSGAAAKFVNPTKDAPQPAAPVTPVKAEPKQETVDAFKTRLKDIKFCFETAANDEENKQLATWGMMVEAGWHVNPQLNLLLPKMSNAKIKLADGSIADYVLTSATGKPLAVIDQSTSAINPIEGRKKVMQQIDLIQKQYSCKVAGYYMDGYVTMFIDPLGSAPRRVFGLHTLAELEGMVTKLSLRKDISNPAVDPTITDRDPIVKAVQKICNVLNEGKRRRVLTVMATGVGKTRLAVATSKILLNGQWAEKILFLADRTSLVKQALKAFAKYLPTVTTSEYTGDNDSKNKNANVILSTYSTMMGMVNGEKREFGIGAFDLIIVDEAHRSIFKKYGTLFNYFDALMIGLTATPRDEDNKSTYDVFGLPNAQPDYHYELGEAVKDGYLVGFEIIDRTTEALKNKINWADLSDAERDEIEDQFADDPETILENGGDIKENQLGRKVLNQGTIDVMLDDLMKNGIKINGGDEIGKTIIFAKSIFEADFIVERFQKIYKHLPASFIARIDSKVPNAQDLLDHFSVKDEMPRIAVSVDMLDTGVDVQEIVNLVFFKKVKSKIKFLQMIGRGTRTCKDLFGPGSDKTGFYIFDFYDNFEYFNVKAIWSSGKFEIDDGGKKKKTKKDLSQNGSIWAKKLLILTNIQGNPSPIPFEVSYEQELRTEFHNQCLALNNEDLSVHYDLAYVNKYRKAQYWLGISEPTAEEIVDKIIPLFPSLEPSVKKKSFDLLVYHIEANHDAYVGKGLSPLTMQLGFGVSVIDSLNTRVMWFKKNMHIPQLKAREAEILSLQDGHAFFDNFSLENCEKVRKSLRDLMDFLPDDRRYVVINIPDEVIAGNGGVVSDPYDVRAMKYIADHTGDDTALIKLSTIEALTQDEKDHLHQVFENDLGTPAEFAAWNCAGADFLAFLRSKVGITDEAIDQKFGTFFNQNVLNPVQLSYVQTVVDFARANGDIITKKLQEPPFIHYGSDLTKLFEPQKLKQLADMIKTIHGAIL